MVRLRAEKFARDWKGQDVIEAAESHTFWDEFFHIFGMKRRDFAKFEYNVRLLPRPGKGLSGRIDLFWQRKLLVEHKSPGRDLDEADRQALRYYEGLDADIRPQYVISCDFNWFRLRDLKSGGDTVFELEHLPSMLGHLGFMSAGADSETYDEEINQKAAYKMDAIYDLLSKEDYGEDLLGMWLVRIAYCLFAEDSGIFEKNQFREYIERYTRRDGGDLGSELNRIFTVLDTPPGKRRSMPADLGAFRYIDGGLFSDRLEEVFCSREIREAILAAADFAWDGVSPSIFGSMFEGMMSGTERRRYGAHYTTTRNVHRVIDPLFMDGLYREYGQIVGSDGTRNEKRSGLLRLQDRLRSLRFLDPACGSGSFLITSYQDLRTLELDIIRFCHREAVIRDSTVLSKVNVDQFYGIELKPYAAKITEAAMWMVDHIENLKIANHFEGAELRIPLREHATIRVGDALEVDWNDVLPGRDCSYIIGNPPFGGGNQGGGGPDQTKRITGHGDLDYVSNWFVKSAEYCNERCRVGLVSTNSIIQGEQVGDLWPTILDKHGMRIIFGYTPFPWMTDARDAARVHVVILGLSKTHATTNHIYDAGGGRTAHRYISPYLRGFSKRVPLVTASPVPVNGLGRIRQGSTPIDDGMYIFTDEEREAFLKKEPGAERYLRPYITGRSFLNGGDRWILELRNIRPSELAGLVHVKKLTDEVSRYRAGRKRKNTIKLARTPTVWNTTVIPERPFLILPKVSSRARRYIPVGFRSPPAIPSDKAFIVENATADLFGLLSSRMHMAWVELVAGRMKSDYSYSSSVVYNTFPLPDGDLGPLARHAEEILRIRGMHGGQSLADLYGTPMQPDLLRAHERLDAAVDRLYREEPFGGDLERWEFLLGRYEAMRLGGLRRFRPPRKIKKRIPRQPGPAPRRRAAGSPSRRRS
ncbi:Type II restriction enzyme [Nitrosopumilaceae archaeon]|nr:Type II restriction enzyme [Nitrosopumilaceae archaeon]